MGFIVLSLYFNRSHTGCCIEVFGRCGLHNEVKLTLAAVGYTGSHPSICVKVFIVSLPTINVAVLQRNGGGGSATQGRAGG